jgi:anti-sigma regulatory factor (Ser/Thr protein kinase)
MRALFAKSQWDCSAVIWAFSSSDGAKAHRAREQFLDALRLRTPQAADCAACETIFGELVSNAVRHAPGAIRVALDWNGNKAILCVEDSGPVFDYDPALPVNVFAENGRGLYLIRALAGDIDIERFAEGKAIRVVLPVSVYAA